MKKKWIYSLTAIATAVSMLPMTAFAQEINMEEEMVANPQGEVKAEFEVDADYASEMGYDLIVSFPLNISLTYDSETESFTGSDSVYAYGLTEADTMVQVAVNKEHSGYGTLIGPSMETYDISATVSETIDGSDKGTVSADTCYGNLLAVKGMEGKTTDDLSTMELSVSVPSDSFIPRYKGTYYTCVPLVITIEEAAATRASGLYGNDGIAFVSWEDMTENVGSYYCAYRDTTLTDFSVFYMEDNGAGHTLTSNYETYYTYTVDGEEMKSTTLPNTEEIDNGKYNTAHYNYSDSYLDETYEYISGELVLPEGISVLGEHALDCMTNFRSVILPDSLTTIKAYALSNQWNAITLTMKTGVTTIEDNAFENCSGLTDIYYEGTEEQWNAISIGETGNDILSTVTIHYNYTGAEE